MMNDSPERDRPWLRAFILILDDRRCFGRFMTALIVVLCFALLAGWLWNAAIIGPICLILLRYLRPRSPDPTADPADNQP
jgi:hypothetical protein